MFTYNQAIFYERKKMDEFTCGHPMVRTLFEYTRIILQDKNINIEYYGLDIFNQAYYLCTLIVEQKAGLKETQLAVDAIWKANGRFIAEVVLAVARTLLRIHARLVEIKPETIGLLSNGIVDDINTAPFTELANNHAWRINKVMNFSGMRKPIAKARQATDDPQQKLERALASLMEAREALKKASDDKDLRIGQLEKQLQQERLLRDVQERKYKLQQERQLELERQMEQMRQLEKQHTKQLEQKKQPAQQERADGLQQAINLQTIGQYACALGNDNHAEVVSTMLSKLTLKAPLTEAEKQKVNQVVEEIDQAHRPTRLPLNVHIGHQQIYNDNQNSQVFNGQIDNSKFER